MSNTTAKAIFVEWAEKSGVRPMQLAQEIGCTYEHAWHLLRDKKYAVALPTLAKLLIVYGAEGPALEMARVTPLN